MQLCREVGTTYQTLKFYCNEGLVPNVKRDKNNRRIFDDHNVSCGQKSHLFEKLWHEYQEMKEFLNLCLSRRIEHIQKSS